MVWGRERFKLSLRGDEAIMDNFVNWLLGTRNIYGEKKKFKGMGVGTACMVLVFKAKFCWI